MKGAFVFIDSVHRLAKVLLVARSVPPTSTRIRSRNKSVLSIKPSNTHQILVEMPTLTWDDLEEDEHSQGKRGPVQDAGGKDLGVGEGDLTLE